MTTRRLTKRRNVLDNRKDEVLAALVAGGTYSETAEKFKVSKAAISFFIQRHEDEYRALQAKVAKAAEDYAIAVKVNRIAAKDDRWQRLKQVIDERAADGAKNWPEVPGMATGVMVHQLRQIGAGKNALTIDEFEVDTGTLAEMSRLEREAADELGQLPKPSISVDNSKTYVLQVIGTDGRIPLG